MAPLSKQPAQSRRRRVGLWSLGSRPDHIGVVDALDLADRAYGEQPRRIVVELSADEYRALEAARRGRCVTGPELVRLVALRLARLL